MKRWAKAWLAVGVGCCVCGAALTGIGVASGGSKYVKSADLNKMDGAAKKSDNEMVLEKTKLDDFDSADISMTDMNLQVVSSDDQYCYISYRASDQKKDPISYQVKDGKLRIQENNNDGKTYYHVDIGFLSGLLGEGTLTTDENVVTIYVPEGQKWKLADIKSDMSNILLNGCEIENGAVQTDSGDVFFKNCDFNNLKVKTDMGDLCFIGKEDVMRTWNIQVNTDMGDINVDDALTGKMVEDQDDCDISYTQKGTGGNLVIQTDRKYKAEVQITLLFTSVMIRGILGAFCVRVPVSYIMSIQPNISLFHHIGLATPMSSILQLILCVGFMLWLQKNRLLDDKH